MKLNDHNHIYYQNGQLQMEGVAVSELAKQYGTPLYLYSSSVIADNFNAYKNAAKSIPTMVCYAIKANSNLAILQALAKLGAGFDIVSGGELQRVLQAGGDASKVVFSGVGKTADEMALALEAGVHCFNVESDAELSLLSRVASQRGDTARISLRVNPDVDPKTHPYISTGLRDNKFGITFEQAPAVYQRAAGLPGIEIVGVDCHIGSQLTELAPFNDAVDRLLELIAELKAQGISLEHIDMGGGLGINYSGSEAPPTKSSYLAALESKLANTGLSLILEPGRSIVGDAGVLVTQVQYLKPTAHKNFAIVDAAMNDNIRPALYQAEQRIVSVTETSDAPVQTWDLVGPVCESADFIGKDRPLALTAGDYLAQLDAGAYCFGMASNYNTRARAAEVLIAGDDHWLVRERETFADLIRGEHLLP
ncbi:diaminopimelate decarboxylase [Halioxenophilus aromaticivorans]|uniref:Diaminopimelate decarboxylase n=1 Tax=Halioxenophilus aromaticivorans TaxID=1306992 RepID=A0AAV3U687_9ALTE